MKKSGLINRDISTLVAAMGHYDRLVVSDAGFPIPKGQDYVDLSLGANLPTVSDVVRVLAHELEIEEVYVAAEALEFNSNRLNELEEIFPNAKVTTVPHAKFKAMATEARGTIRTGDFTSYANVMLVSGVVY